MSTQPDKPAAPDDAELWLQQLASVQDGDGDMTPDMRSLRRAITLEALQQERALADTDEDAAHALERLQFRLRKEKLLGRSWPQPWMLALAASCAAIAIGSALYLQQPVPTQASYSEPPMWRGPANEFDLRVADPRAQAQKLAQTLRASGLQADIYQMSNTFTVDTALGNPIPARVLDMFGTLGVAPKAGQVRINFGP